MSAPPKTPSTRLGRRARRSSYKRTGMCLSGSPSTVRRMAIPRRFYAFRRRRSWVQAVPQDTPHASDWSVLERAIEVLTMPTARAARKAIERGPRGPAGAPIAAALIEEAETLRPGLPCSPRSAELRRRGADKFTRADSSPASRRSRVARATGRRSRRDGSRIHHRARSVTALGATARSPSPTRRTFKPWLSDMVPLSGTREGILRIISDGQRGRHAAHTRGRPGNSGATSTATGAANAVTAAATEAQKLRTRRPGCATYLKTRGHTYLEYIAVGDDG